MGIVASLKTPLQIRAVYLRCLRRNIGGGEEAKDEGEAGSYRGDGGPVPRGEQEGKASVAGSVCEHHGIQPLVRPVCVAARRTMPSTVIDFHQQRVLLTPWPARRT